MKKSIFTIAILLSLFSVVLSSCNKDDNDDDNSSPLNSDASATYKLEMDGNIVAEGTATKSVIFYAGELQMKASIDNIVITMDKVPESIGGENSVEGTDGSQIQIGGKNLLESGEDESYYAFTGAVTRTSETKISFEGTCAVMPSAEEHTFSGYVESDAFKVK